ncbi:MAG: hypothetical protein H6579_01175 [Chitinophagales bacterium]|nr:hypothetical protein [Chitinophagales bacterium]
MSKAQNFIDFQQRRIDLLDGVEDKKCSDSLFSSIYFEQIDRIQIELSELSPNRKEKMEFAIYQDLYRINTDFLNSHSIQASKYNYFEEYLKACSQNKQLQYLYAYPEHAYQILPLILYEEHTSTFLESEANKDASLVLENYASFFEAAYSSKILSLACQNDPIAAKKYFYGKQLVYTDLKKSDDKIDQLIIEIFNAVGRNSKAYNLLELIAHEKISILEADELSKENDIHYFNALLSCARNPKALARQSFTEELEYISLQKIRPINALYEVHMDKNRFSSLAVNNAEQIYSFIIYSEEEIFTSSFNGIYDLLLSKIKEENMSSYQLLEKLGFNEYGNFLKICASYSKLQNFLERMSPEEKSILLEKFVSLDSSTNLLKDAVCLADCIASIADSTTLMVLETSLIEKSHLCEKEEVKLAYDLLLAFFSSKSVLTKKPSMQEGALFEICNLGQLNKHALFGEDSIHTELHIFYDDEDGRSSYVSFLNTFKSSKWKIEYQSNFTIIKSIKGKRVELYLTNPTLGHTSASSILAYLNSKNQDLEVLVHRGHSFYLPSSLEYLNPQIKLVILGSCGGYNKVLDILNKAPDAQIISTKQIGSYLVNNPLILRLVENINSGEDILWEEFWLSLGEKLKTKVLAFEKFQEYQAPHQNLGASFIRTYKSYQYKI